MHENEPSIWKTSESKLLTPIGTVACGVLNDYHQGVGQALGIV